jgi:hypothetical protein
METVANILIKNNVNIHQQPDPKSPLVTVPIILDQAVGDCFNFFISLLVIVPIILDQDVDYCSGDFGSGCW